MNKKEMKQKLKTMYPKSENWVRKVVDTWTLISDQNAEPFKKEVIMTKVTKKQIRRTPFGSCYMVLYIKHRFDPENDSCILLGEDGTLRKELTKVVGTWALICNPDTKPHKCDLFLEEVLGNIGTDAVDGA